MPYPNSHSPFTLFLNVAFRRAQRDDPEKLLALLESDTPLPEIARQYGFDRTAEAMRHLQDWPLQDELRQLLIRAVEERLELVFDWERASTTSMSKVRFSGTQVGVTFKSPLNYPPYTEA